MHPRERFGCGQVLEFLQCQTLVSEWKPSASCCYLRPNRAGLISIDATDFGHLDRERNLGVAFLRWHSFAANLDLPARV